MNRLKSFAAYYVFTKIRRSREVLQFPPVSHEELHHALAEQSLVIVSVVRSVGIVCKICQRTSWHRIGALWLFVILYRKCPVFLTDQAAFISLGAMIVIENHGLWRID